MLCGLGPHCEEGSWLVMIAAVQGLHSAQSLLTAALGSCKVLHIPSLGGRVFRLGLLLPPDLGALDLLRESGGGRVGVCMVDVAGADGGAGGLSGS